jgi:uncharacterized protein YndB with AHSA1/START domain
MKRLIVCAVMLISASALGQQAATELMKIGPIEFQTKASPEKVWDALTNAKTISQWMAPEAKVELSVGGAYELYFMPGNPPGKRGMEGTKVLSFAPNRMISYSGMPTCKWMAENHQAPWAVFIITPLPDGGSHVYYAAFGTASGEDCQKQFAMYNQVMPGEMKKLQAVAEGKPVIEDHVHEHSGK